MGQKLNKAKVFCFVLFCVSVWVSQVITSRFLSYGDLVTLSVKLRIESRSVGGSHHID